MARPYKNSSDYQELVAFGSAVRSIRLDKGVSQEALADLAGIDRSYMGGVERGEHNISLINIKRISDALTMPVSAVMKKSEL